MSGKRPAGPGEFMKQWLKKPVNTSTDDDNVTILAPNTSTSSHSHINEVVSTVQAHPSDCNPTKKTSYEQQSEQIKSVESLTITSLERELERGPYQPTDVGHLDIPKQNLKGKVRHFQSGWFVRYPWLHYSLTIQAALC
jgi:hypothetical protein